MQAYRSLYLSKDKEKRAHAINAFIAANEPAIMDMLTLIAQVCDISICGISLVQQGDEWITFSKGTNTEQIQDKNSFFTYIKKHKCDLSIVDTTKDSQFNSDTIVTGDLRVRFFKNLCFFDTEENFNGFLFLMHHQTVRLLPPQINCLAILHKQITSLLNQIRPAITSINVDQTHKTKTGNKSIKMKPEASCENRENSESHWETNFNESIDFKNALDLAAIISITDQKGIITYANNNFCRSSKYGREELIGQDHRIINSGHHPKSFFTEMWDTIQEGKIWKGEIKNKAKDGNLYWVNATIVPVLNEAGKPKQYISIRTNITSIKNTESDLVKSLKEISDYKYALDESSIVAITDQKGIINYVNDNFCRISKYSREELIGKDHRIINSGFHSKEFIRDLWTTIKRGKIWKGELQNKAKDGSLYWVDTVIVPFLNEDGNPYQYVAIRSDITQIKISEKNIDLLNETLAKNERKFRALIENTEDIITLLDSNMATLYRSPSAARITGWSITEMEAVTKFERIHTDDVRDVQEIMNSVFKEAGGTRHLAFRMLHKKGHYIWLEGSVTNMLNDPSLNGIVLNLRDVTERKNVEGIINDKNKQISDILERINDGFIALDKNYNYTYANVMIKLMTGKDPSFLIGKNVWEVFPDIVGSKTYNAFINAMETQQYQTNIDYYPSLNLWQENHVYPSRDGLVVFIKDISYQKAAEQQIKQAHDRLSYHLQNTPLALIEFDQDFIITNWSPQATKFFGWTQEEMLGKHFSEVDMVYYEDVDYATNIAEQLLSGQVENIKSSNRNTTKTGAVIHCEWHISVLKNSNGEVVSMMALVQDVTERIMAEQALRISEERFDAFMNASPAVAWMLDEDGRHIYMNKSWEKLFRLNKEQWLGKTVFDLLPEAVAAVISESNQRVITSGQSIDLTDTVLVDGKQYYANSFKFPFKNSSGQLLLGGMAIDVTEQKLAEQALKESEEKYRVLIEEGIDGIVVYNPVKNKFLNVNKKLLELVGYSEEELLNMGYSNFLLDESSLGTTMDAALKNNHDGIKFEKLIQRSNGNFIDVEVSVKIMPDGNYLCYIRDITERKKAALEIVQLNEDLEHKVIERTLQLETANKDLEAFSYSVSHDLRTPLRAIHGYANILEEDYINSLDEEGIRLLNEVQKNAKKMGMLIDDLLTFSRMGRKQIVTTVINMNGISITAFDEIHDQFKKKVEFVLNNLEPAMADYSLIKQVMINLLSNAIKYSSKSNHPKIIVSSSMENNEIVYSICDNGVGFDMKYVNKLFGVFQRLHSSDEFEGMGVGLATVQRIINKHGGRVWAEGKLNEGATFYFSLPQVISHD